MTRFLNPLLALLALAAPALAQTRALPPGEIRANGDITFGNALKLGKRDAGKTIITPDTLQILGSGSTGEVSLMNVVPNASAPTNTLSRLIADKAALDNPVFRGNATAPRLTLPMSGQRQTYNLHVSPPDNGVFLAGGGNEISFCPWLGCSQNYPINTTAGWVRTKTAYGVERAETNFALDQYAVSGFIAKWKPSTAYKVGDRVVNGIERYLYEVIVAGTSAASGGPTVVGTPPPGDGLGAPGGTQPTQADGTITWKFIQDADYTDTKTTFNVTTYVGPNAGHTWSSAINTLMGPGAQTDLAVTQELDFSNHSGFDCQASGKNCWLNLWFMQGENTSTSFVQAAAGGDAPAINEDNSSGGAALTGISFNGANTIRTVTFSDGTNAATTLKGYPGTRHVSGFINDESAGPSSYRASGQYSYATFNDVGTSPYGFRWDGTYSVAASKYQNYLLGNWGGGAGYQAISFNNSLAAADMNGFFGSASDQVFYANTKTAFQFRVANAGILDIDVSRVKTVNRFNSPLYTPPSSSAACQAGDFANDANYHYVCVATNTWKRAVLSAF